MLCLCDIFWRRSVAQGVRSLQFPMSPLHPSARVHSCWDQPFLDLPLHHIPAVAVIITFLSNVSFRSKYVIKIRLYVLRGSIKLHLFLCGVHADRYGLVVRIFFNLHNWLNVQIITSCMFLQSTGCATIDRLFYVDNIHLSGTINRLRYVSWAIDRLNFAQDIKYQYTQYSWYHLQFCSCTVN